MTKKKTRRQIAPPDEIRVKPLAESALQGTDMACALICGAYVENVTGWLLQKCMIDDKLTHGEEGLLNGPYGILNTASARVNMAYCLGLIGKEVHKNAKTIAHVRNRFAHSHLPVDFNDEVIQHDCSQLHFQIVNHELIKPPLRPLDSKKTAELISKARLRLVVATLWTIQFIQLAASSERIENEKGEWYSRPRKQPSHEEGKMVLVDVRPKDGRLFLGTDILLDE